jgi:SAM-dependent methyltransferase
MGLEPICLCAHSPLRLIVPAIPRDCGWVLRDWRVHTNGLTPTLDTRGQFAEVARCIRVRLVTSRLAVSFTPSMPESCRYRKYGREWDVPPSFPSVAVYWRRHGAGTRYRHRRAQALSVPNSSRSADLVISGQSFEHMEFFWLAWLEMCRIVRPGGLIFLLAPSRGPEHRYPVDCWRFYPDGFRALAKWAGVCLLEVSTHWEEASSPDSAPWGDTMGVFRRYAETTAGAIYRGNRSTCGLP